MPNFLLNLFANIGRLKIPVTGLWMSFLVKMIRVFAKDIALKILLSFDGICEKFDSEALQSIPGFAPVIFSITPLTNIIQFLGLADKSEKSLMVIFNKKQQRALKTKKA